MDFQVVWTDPALADLQEIVAYISRDDPAAAERVGNDIVDHVETLRTFPLIGPTYPRGTSGNRREIVCGSSAATIGSFTGFSSSGSWPKFSRFGMVRAAHPKSKRPDNTLQPNGGTGGVPAEF